MTCVLCGRELPPLRWWQRVLTAPPMCPNRDFEECRQRFMIRFGAGEGKP